MGLQGKSVADGGVDLGILCAQCNAKSKQRHCYVCKGLIITERWPVDGQGRPYHEECLVCAVCSIGLGGQSYTADPKSGRLICRSCYDSTCEPCARCGLLIKSGGGLATAIPV